MCLFISLRFNRMDSVPWRKARKWSLILSLEIADRKLPTSSNCKYDELPLHRLQGDSYVRQDPADRMAGAGRIVAKR